VMRRGRLVAELDARKTTQEEILRHAAVDEEESQVSSFRFQVRDGAMR